MIDFTYYEGLRRLKVLHKKLDPWSAFLPSLICFGVNCDRDLELMEYAMKVYTHDALVGVGGLGV